MLGRIVNVGRLGGIKGEFDFDLHALQRIDYIGVTFRTRIARGGARDRTAACAPICGPRSRPASCALPIDRTFPLDRGGGGAGAHAANQHFGKIVLRMWVTVGAGRTRPLQIQCAYCPASCFSSPLTASSALP